MQPEQRAADLDTLPGSSASVTHPECDEVPQWKTAADASSARLYH